MKIISSKLFAPALFCCLLFLPFISFAQSETETFGFRDDLTEVKESTSTATSTIIEEGTASATAANIIGQQAISSKGNDLTRPEELPEKVAIITLFEDRPVNELSFINAMAFWVQESVRDGIPANTIFLILLTPFLALFVSFVRVVVGLPTLDMLVPIALSFALVAVGVTVGLLVLGAILVASYISKKILSHLRIMFYPKRSLSIVLLAISVFAALSIGVAFEFEKILSVSIFPILVLLLLGDMIVSVQLHKSPTETLMITGTTIFIGLIGYMVATSDAIQNTIILYPELVLLVIPANLLIGRYFGLRVFEVFRFSKVSKG
ncbi:hypothetical protein KC865_01785 [Candidatus Kaiserbacteria bacterium]|nr:hypothetical protein [Candidatus Kaiserbacteria bacterium]USN91982.1 MAG: hypothetical protein H6782_03850 [Candidatus Nomurabacteria bacterium]